MYGCESWTVKKAVRQRIDAFELCCWRRLLRVPWTAPFPIHIHSLLPKTASAPVDAATHLEAGGVLFQTLLHLALTVLTT